MKALYRPEDEKRRLENDFVQIKENAEFISQCKAQICEII